MNRRLKSSYLKKLSINELKSESGFTILELMIASAVFAVILLVVAVGVISITDSYYKGIVGSQTQSTTRAIMSEISESIEFGSNIQINNAGSNNIGWLCIDNATYIYQLGQEVIDQPISQDQGYHGLVVNESSGTCPTSLSSFPYDSSALPANSRELLNQYMRLASFSVTNSGNLYTIHLRIIYGDDSVLNPTPTGNTVWATQGSSENCIGAAGTQFCGVSDLETTVEQRLE